MTEAWGLALGMSVLLGVWLGPVAVLVVVGFVLILQIIRDRLNLAILVVVSLVAILGVLRAEIAADSATFPPNLHRSTGATGRVVSMPKASSHGNRVEIAVETLSFSDGTTATASFGALVWLPDEADVVSGDEVRGVWTVDSVERLPPGYGRYVTAQGASASGRAWSVIIVKDGSSFMGYLTHLQQRLTDRLRKAIPGDAGSLAAGIVTGNDASMREEVQVAFQRTGTSHITAVSGSNVAMLLALWNIVIHSSRTRRALEVQLVIVVVIWLYTLLVGFEPSAVRAALVASLGLFAGRFGRRADALTILALATGAMAFWNPDYTRMVGFWLSVLASFAFVSRIPASNSITTRVAIVHIAQGIALAQAATLPVILATFGTWSISSVLANLLLQPLMTLGFPLAFILALVVMTVPLLAPLIAWIPGLLLDFALAVVIRLSPMVSPVQLEATGTIGLLAVAIPCIGLMLLASQDVHRWRDIVRRRWTRSHQIAGTLLVSSLVGIATGIVAALMR